MDYNRRGLVLMRFAVFAGVGCIVGLISGTIGWFVFSAVGYPEYVGRYFFIVFLVASIVVSIFRNWHLIGIGGGVDDA